jgi:hypothetical protein
MCMYVDLGDLAIEIKLTKLVGRGKEVRERGSLIKVIRYFTCNSIEIFYTLFGLSSSRIIVVN